MVRERLMPISIEGYKPLREIVYEALMESIMSGALPPGERLMEVQLAEEMGISRTPVREAIRRLETEGFVEMIPRKGAYVAGLSINDALSIFEVRKAMEGLAAYLSAQRITDEQMDELKEIHKNLEKAFEDNCPKNWVKYDASFHEHIYRSTGNNRLMQIMSNLSEQFNRYRIITLSAREIHTSTITEHQLIMDALEKHDPDLSKEMAESHISITEDMLVKVLKIKLPNK